MLKLLNRQITLIPTKHVQNFGAYVDTEQEMFHRKLRRIFYDRTVIDFTSIPELEVRTREPADILKNLWKNKSVAGIVRARDGFPELNLVHKARDVFDIYKDMLTYDGLSQPYNLSIDEDSDYFKVNIEDVAFHHFYSNWPMFMIWNRFIPGQPNRMKMRVVIDNWEGSEARFRGGRIEMREDIVDVDVYVEQYPRVIKANFEDMLPGKTYTIKSLLRDLPDGVKLAPHYAKRMWEPLYIVQKTLKSHIYWRHLKHTFDVSKFADLDLAMMNLEPKETQAEAEKKIDPNVFLTKAEEEKMQKLATMLGKDYEELKKEILATRQMKIQQEALKEKSKVKK